MKAQIGGGFPHAGSGARRAVGALVVVLSGILGQRLPADIILESVDWTAQGAAPISALGGSWSYGTVTGTTAAVLNGGAVYAVTWDGLPFTTGYSTTIAEGISLGAANSSTQVQTFTFSNPVSSVYLFFSWTEDDTSFDFGPYTWTLVGANHAYRAGSRVVVSGAADAMADGFLVNITETFGPGQDLAFSFINSTTRTPGQTVGFNLGQGVPAPVPEPGTWVPAVWLLLGAVGARQRRRTPRV